MLLFLLGVLVGVVAMLLAVLKARRESARLDEEKQTASQEKQIIVDFMHHMVEALGERLTRQDLMQRIVHAAILCTGALSACIFERTPDDQMRGVAVEGLFPPHRPLPPAAREKLATRAKFIEQMLKTETFPVGEGIVGAVVATGRGVLIANAASDPRIVTHEDPALAVKSVIAVPLAFQDRFIGVLAVTNPADGLPFTPADFSLMSSLAEQAAMALHNAEFFAFQLEKKQLDLDLSLARGIQQLLLPRAAPRVAGLDVDARYLPSQKIGGDLYDLFELPGGRFGVAVADVSGKGIPASLLMAIGRTNLRQVAPRHDSPARALAELNRAMRDEISQGLFITMLYAIIDPAKNEAAFARAGHELPLFVRPGRNAGPWEGDFTGSEGMPLGLADPELFETVLADRTVPFAPGDVLVLYTDGITEAANLEGKEYAGSRLADVARLLHAESAREINDGILESVHRFAGEAPQRDDLTLVTVKRV